MSFPTIEWHDGKVVMIDQRLLPREETYNHYDDVEGVAVAIETMVIRGAPAIGVAAAMGAALVAREAAKNPARFDELFAAGCARLLRTRPTAVNLRWALERMEKLVAGLKAAGKSPAEIVAACEDESQQVLVEDIEINRKMGAVGAAYIPDGATVLTHCNAGALATGGYGTALGVIRAAVEAGKKVQVIADETRPFLQGARLTAWELMKDNIPVTLITDNMAAHFMKQGKVDCVVVGADRVAANGDAANKIGTYGVAVLAEKHKIPFYVAAPLSTVDLRCPTGEQIPIEQRDTAEVAVIGGTRMAPEGCRIWNPAFDVTPAPLIRALFTEAGAAEPPGVATIAALFKK